MDGARDPCETCLVSPVKRALPSLLFASLLAACIRPRPALSVTDASAPTRTAPPPDLAPVAPALAPPAPVPAPDPAPTIPYVERVAGGAQAQDTLPLVVALHGLGDTPDSFIELVTSMNLRARVVAPRGLDPWGPGYSWFVSRREAAPEVWAAGIRRAADAVIPLIRTLRASRPTCGLPVVMGFSQGGMLSYAIVAREDAGVGAALPISGVIPRSLWPAERPIGGMLPSVWAFHGTVDDRVPFADDRATHAHFVRVGFPGRFREYPNVGHSITPAMARDVRETLVETLRSLGCAS